MSDALEVTIVYEPDADSDWIMVSIPEVPGVLSQGKTREEARENVLSALNDWLSFYLDEQGPSANEVPADAERESLHLTFA
jgi:predicted RNase H-like HicB family nuclease